MSAAGVRVEHDEPREHRQRLGLAVLVSSDERLDRVGRRRVQLVGHQSLVDGHGSLDGPRVLSLGGRPQHGLDARHVAATDRRHETVGHAAEHCTPSRPHASPGHIGHTPVIRVNCAA